MIETLFHKNKGYLFAKDIANKRNLYYQLNKLIDKGLVLQIKRGLYKYPEIAELNHWQEISLIYPNAVIYLFSAFSYYNLSNYIPPVTHLAIDRKRKMLTSAYLPVKLHYIDRKIFKLHQTEVDGVKIYSPERTVCDAIKHENQVGADIITEVTKNFYKSEHCNLNLLYKTAREINIDDKLRQIMQIIVNI
jgi:predicted transcriptional regulator of viral defense system